MGDDLFLYAVMDYDVEAYYLRHEYLNALVRKLTVMLAIFSRR